MKKTAQLIASEISDLMYNRARINKKIFDETSTFSSISDECIEEGQEIDPTLNLSKDEIHEISGRKRLKEGFLMQLKAELEQRNVMVKVDLERKKLKLKSTFYTERPTEFGSIRQLKASIKMDEEFEDF